MIIPKKNGLSYQNEPSNQFVLTANFRQYPDMKMVYDIFTKKMSIQRSLVIGSGFETTMKNILLALHPKSLFWIKPAWKFIDTYCQQFNINPINSYYSFKDGEFKINSFLDADSIYQTIYSGPFFKHENIDLNFLTSKYKIVFLDLSYCNIETMKKYLNLEYKNLITISSFDKLYGCGLRFGFATYPKEFEMRIQLCRERCINAAAANFVINQNFDQIQSKYLNSIIQKYNNIIISNTNNFILIKSEKNQFKSNSKIVQVQNEKFIRFGIPSNDCEYELLCKDLNSII